MSGPYVVEYQDSRSRWHRARTKHPRPETAVEKARDLGQRGDVHGWRVLDATGSEIDSSAVRRRTANAAILAIATTPTPEEETMTKSTTPRAEIEKRRRVAKKQAAEIGGTVERRGDEFVVVRSDAAVSAAVAAIEPVAELAASDPAAVDGVALAATLRERIAASIEGAELVASPTAIEHRVRLAGRTLAYVTPQKRSVRVTVTAEPRVKVKVDSPETIEAAVAAIDDAARTAAS